ncbi:MAG: hypothetical protein ACLP59_12415 [Bryobacteraceae bacterium]
MTLKISAALLILAGAPAWAHRLDEYLQGTLISVEKSRIEAQITLTPGVIVFPLLIPDIDTDADGVISEAEQRAYAARVLRDLSLSIDGHRLTPRLLSMRFPAVDEMKEGLGQIQLEFEADLPPGGRHRKLTLENRHQSRIAAYQVNCLAPRDPRIRIAAQNRNYSQSHYGLEYEETDVYSRSFFLGLWSGSLAWLSPIAFLLFARFGFLLWRRDGH